MIPGDLPEVNNVPQQVIDEFKGVEPDVIRIPFGTKIKSGNLDLANTRIRAMSVNGPDGVDGILIETVPGSGVFEYLFSSAGFVFPGGLFTGSINPNITASYNIGRDDFVTQRWNTIYLVNAPNVSSDIRFKDNVRQTLYGLTEVERMNPIQYSRDGKEHIGFSAQDLQEVLPEIVSANQEGHLSVSFEEIIPVLVNAIKELRKEIVALKK